MSKSTGMFYKAVLVTGMAATAAIVPMATASADEGSTPETPENWVVGEVTTIEYIGEDGTNYGTFTLQNLENGERALTKWVAPTGFSTRPSGYLEIPQDMNITTIGDTTISLNNSSVAYSPFDTTVIKSIKEINLPSTVKHIGVAGLRGFSGLTKPINVSQFDSFTYSSFKESAVDLTNMNHSIIPESAFESALIYGSFDFSTLSEINSSAFYGADFTNADSVTQHIYLSDKLTSLGLSTFSKSKGMQSINVQASIEELSASTFEDIVFLNSLSESMSSNTQGISAVHHITIGGMISTIGDSAIEVTHVTSDRKVAAASVWLDISKNVKLIRRNGVTLAGGGVITLAHTDNSLVLEDATSVTGGVANAYTRNIATPVIVYAENALSDTYRFLIDTKKLIPYTRLLDTNSGAYFNNSLYSLNTTSHSFTQYSPYLFNIVGLYSGIIGHMNKSIHNSGLFSYKSDIIDNFANQLEVLSFIPTLAAGYAPVQTNILVDAPYSNNSLMYDEATNKLVVRSYGTLPNFKNGQYTADYLYSVDGWVEKVRPFKANQGMSETFASRQVLTVADIEKSKSLFAQQLIHYPNTQAGYDDAFAKVYTEDDTFNMKNGFYDSERHHMLTLLTPEFMEDTFGSDVSSLTEYELYEALEDAYKAEYNVSRLYYEGFMSANVKFVLTDYLRLWNETVAVRAIANDANASYGDWSNGLATMKSLFVTNISDVSRASLLPYYYQQATAYLAQFAPEKVTDIAAAMDALVAKPLQDITSNYLSGVQKAINTVTDEATKAAYVDTYNQVVHDKQVYDAVMKVINAAKAKPTLDKKSGLEAQVASIDTMYNEAEKAALHSELVATIALLNDSASTTLQAMKQKGSGKISDNELTALKQYAESLTDDAQKQTLLQGVAHVEADIAVWKPADAALTAIEYGDTLDQPMLDDVKPVLETVTNTVDKSNLDTRFNVLQTAVDNGATVPPFKQKGGATFVDNVNVGLESGEFAISSEIGIKDFGDVAIAATPQMYHTSFEEGGFVYVSDSRGTREGWHVTVSATPFTEVLPDGSLGELQLPLGSFAFDSSTVTVERVGQVANEGNLPEVLATTAQTAIDAGEVTFLSAQKDYGLGAFKAVFGENSFGLMIDNTTAKVNPDNLVDGYTPYQSTVTWSLVSDPSN